LRRVLGLWCISEQAKRHPVDRCPMPANEPLESEEIADLRGPDEVDLIGLENHRLPIDRLAVSLAIMKDAP
jgi:hypothetical protein